MGDPRNLNKILCNEFLRNLIMVRSLKITGRFIRRYNIVFTVSTYLIPVIVMGCCYTRMSYVLWRSKSIGELNQRQSESIQSKRKVSPWLGKETLPYQIIGPPILVIEDEITCNKHQFCIGEGCANVHGRGNAIRRLLVTLSWLLRIPIHRRPSHFLQARPTHLSFILLASDEQHHD